MRRKNCATFLTRGIRSLLRRRVGDQDFDDTVQDVLLDVLRAIKRGQLRQAEAVLAFARTVAVRKSATFIAAAVAERSRRVAVADYTTTSVRGGDQPENRYLEDERRQLAKRALMRAETTRTGDTGALLRGRRIGTIHLQSDGVDCDPI